MRKLNFYDYGQDFLWWKVDADGLVTDCGPFQQDIWVGSKVINETIVEGGRVQFLSKHGELLELKYEVESIETTN